MWPNADTSCRLRAVAERTGLSCEQVLAQLAGPVRINDTGAPTVDAFIPR